MTKKLVDRTKLMTFKGSFKDLKKNGFEFQRLFASNYMQWSFDNGEQYGPHSISIWKRHGGYVEIDDLYGLSKYVVRVLCSPELLETFRHDFSSPMFGESSYYRFLILRDTKEAIPYDADIHESINIFGKRWRNKEEGINEEIHRWSQEFRAKYLKYEIRADSWIIPKLRELHSKGWINPFE